MISQAEIYVSFDEFSAAVSRLAAMKRAPRGAIGNIPKDTLLSAHEGGILVETPVVSSLVPAHQAWKINLSVDAKRLIEVCATLKKLGASGQTIGVSAKERKLGLKFRTTSISVLTVWTEPA